MGITGAIFDCDGVLLDSMRYWHGMLTSAGERFDTQIDIRDFMFVTGMPLKTGCEKVFELTGLGGSAEALYNTHVEIARDFYEHDVRPMEGAQGFLESLQRAGIPMAVATSTPRSLIGRALEVQGFDRFFSAIVSTDQTGYRDKDCPDVYLMALEALGTERASTWVFEDSATGAATAHAEGFPVVAFAGDGDAGRFEGCADIVVAGYGELSLGRLSAYVSEGGEARP